MASVTSNADDMGRSLFRVADALNLRNSTAGGKRLGDEVADVASVAISARVRDRQTQPDGAPLPKLSPRYKRRKVAQGHDPRILIRTGAMTEPDTIRGDVQVTSTTLTMTAGTDGATRDRIGYAEEGDAARNRPPRPLIGLDGAGEAQVDEVFEGAIDAAVRGA